MIYNCNCKQQALSYYSRLIFLQKKKGICEANSPVNFHHTLDK